MLIETGSKLVMIGDSITDAGRARPVGEGLFGGLGQGYPAIVDAILGATCPERRIRVVNVGTSGDTVRHLDSRWQSDVLDLKPDWLSIMIGANDVWRQFDVPGATEIHVLPAEYEATLDRLIAATLPGVKGLVLLTPFYLEACRDDAMRARMDEYGDIVRSLAARYGALLADTQAAFDGVMQHVYGPQLGWDRVHPNVTGHMVLARTLLSALEYTAW